MFKEAIIMDSKEAIMQATIALINENGECIDDITVREICKKADVGLGLINYHFGSKENLIKQCVERIINGIVDEFRSIEEKTIGLTPFDKLDYLGNLTLTYLFDHYAVAKISILGDLGAPKEDDNTEGTCHAYLPLVAACRPDWDDGTLRRKTFNLIAVLQQSFLRHNVIYKLYGIDLTDKGQRQRFHSKILHDILEI